MSDIAIRVDGLSKRYQIGARQEPYYTLRETLTESLARPFQQLWHFFSPNGAGSPTPKASSIWALRDVSFEVKRGEVVGIIGRNGAGKSTLLKILSRITEPTEGRARIHGRVGSLLEVGTGFHPELTGRENIYLNGAILGMKKAEIDWKFDGIVEFAEVEQFIDTPVKHYSTGMYLRLAFAVAAHLEPEILIVDEVLAVGDTAFQKKCLGKMGDVAKEGRTVLFVSHNMEAVQEFCGRTLLIESGSLRMDGVPDTVIHEYLSMAVHSKDGEFDFSNHPGRSARYYPMIKQVVLRSGDGLPTTVFHPYDRLQVELILDPPSPIRCPRVACAIEDNIGRRIMTLASYFQSEQLPDIKGLCRIRCILPELILGSGCYLISVSIGTKYTGLLDEVQNAAWFEVDWRNSYGNGESYHPIYGPVLTKSVWTLLD